MKPLPLLLVAAFAAVLGCATEQPKMAKVSEALPNMPLPPEAEVLSRSGGTDALQIIFVSTLSPEAMTAYYRRVLNSGAWHLVSDIKTTDGVVALYAERKGPPIWVRIHQTAGGPGSTVELAGAVERDSTKGDAAKKG